MRTIVFFCFIASCFGGPVTKCVKPSPPYSCDMIINYYDGCLGHKTQDCTQNGKYIYWRVDKPMNWTDASKACQAVDNGNLVSIQSFDEMHVVKELWYNRAKDTNWVWIGLQCKNPTSGCPANAFTWVDGTQLDYVQWSFLASFDSSLQCAILEHNQPVNHVWYGDAFAYLGYYPYSCANTNAAAVCKLLN